MTDKRQKATKVKCKREESLTKQSIFVEYSILKNKHLSFAAARWRMNTKSTRRHVKSDKFVFVTPWLLDLLCKHWFASSVWNFCCWVADVPPYKTSRRWRARRNGCFRRLTLMRQNYYHIRKNKLRRNSIKSKDEF